MSASRLSAEGVLLAYPFRTFFLLASLSAALLMGIWIALLQGWLRWPNIIYPSLWHAHEMVYGVFAAAIAGFLLTAVCNWTGSEPLKGPGLAALALLWLAGRLANTGVLPLSGLLADQAFLLGMAGYFAWLLLRHRNRRNAVIALALLALAAGDALLHSALTRGDLESARSALLFSLDTVTLLVVIIGGRIIPLFTNNWCRSHDMEPAARAPLPVLELGAILSIAALALSDLATPWQPVPAFAAFIAVLFNGWRLLRWRGWRTHAEPLLWSLHLAYAWLVVGLMLRASTALLPALPASVWLHALTVGGLGLMVLAVMSRVALGHTGRPLQLPSGMVWGYVALLLAAVLRLAAALNWLPQAAGLSLAGGLWLFAFGLFAARYWSILSRPRADGRPG